MTSPLGMRYHPSPLPPPLLPKCPHIVSLISSYFSTPGALAISSLNSSSDKPSWSLSQAARSTAGIRAAALGTPPWSGEDFCFSRSRASVVAVASGVLARSFLLLPEMAAFASATSGCTDWSAFFPRSFSLGVQRCFDGAWGLLTTKLFPQPWQSNWFGLPFFFAMRPPPHFGHLRPIPLAYGAACLLASEQCRSCLARSSWLPCGPPHRS